MLYVARTFLIHHQGCKRQTGLLLLSNEVVPNPKGGYYEKTAKFLKSAI